jgi:hypothetical protein
MTKKTRLRPSLATYRELERRLNVANGHIELGTKQLSDLRREYDDAKKEFETKTQRNELTARTKDSIIFFLEMRNNDSINEYANLNALAFWLSASTIVYTAFQIYNGL